MEVMVEGIEIECKCGTTLTAIAACCGTRINCPKCGATIKCGDCGD